MKTQNKNKKKFEALAQVLILIFGIVAISYAVGSEVGVVSGQVSSSTAISECEGKGGSCADKTIYRCMDGKWKTYKDGYRCPGGANNICCLNGTLVEPGIIEKIQEGL